jgi:histidinol-phosphate aminotransferase
MTASGIRNREAGIDLRERTSLLPVVAYNTDRSAIAIDLSHNTNLFGAPPHALDVLRQLSDRDIAEYPGLESGALRRALAAYAGVAPESIITGCGSDQIIESAFHAVTEPGDAVAYPDPTFSMVAPFARMTELVPLGIPLRADFDIDVDAMLATNARVMYVATPNNPTGVLVSPQSIERLLDEAPGVVFIDEAYAEFSGSEWIKRAPAHGRLIVARTMSKAFAMAGLRIGYGAASPDIIKSMEKARGPYTVNALAERAVIAALENDVAWMRHSVQDAIECRDRFARLLRDVGMESLPSATNFLLIPVKDPIGVAQRMESLGVRVRPMPGLPRIGNALRITIGPWALMERTWEVFRESLGS